jgi:hypothetical protein
MVVAVVAAGSLSVPLAGVAWADKPDNPGSQGQGQGKPDNPGSQGQGQGKPDNPGSNGQGHGAFGGPPGAQVRDWAKQPGSVPDVINDSTEFGDLGRIGPGQIVRSFTPGCQDDASVGCAEEATASN